MGSLLPKITAHITHILCMKWKIFIVSLVENHCSFDPLMEIKKLFGPISKITAHFTHVLCIEWKISIVSLVEDHCPFDPLIENKNKLFEPIAKNHCTFNPSTMHGVEDIYCVFV